MVASYSALKKKADKQKSKSASRRTRMYAPVWELIKKQGNTPEGVLVNCPERFQTTVIRGVIKEKTRDEEFGVLGFTKLEIIRKPTSIVFKLLDYRPISTVVQGL